MANLSHTVRVNPGHSMALDGVTVAPALTDTLTLYGVKMTLQEWIRRGYIRPVSTSGFVTTYHVQMHPGKAPGQAGG